MLPMTTSPLERLGTLGVHPRLPGPVIGPLLMLVRAYHPAGGDVNGRMEGERRYPSRIVARYLQDLEGDNSIKVPELVMVHY